jgi:predicted Zn-dependent peptidase
LVAKAPVKVEHTRDALIEIRREFENITSDNKVTGEELERERAGSLTDASKVPWENDEFVLSRLQTVALNNLSTGYFLEIDSAVRRVTIEDVRGVGEILLPDTNLTWVVVGDLARIEADIREMNIGKVEVQDNFGRRLR